MRLVTVGLALAVIPEAATAQEVQLPGWMAGCWETRESDHWAEECWTITRAGMMMGSGRIGTGDRVSSWEFMRIERANEGLTFFASPEGAPWTSFVSLAGAGDSVVFTNTSDDYPQRIRYWREGELLNAEISLEDGSKAMRWTFRRMD